jgi:hypothetical protein
LRILFIAFGWMIQDKRRDALRFPALQIFPTRTRLDNLQR